MGHALAKQQKRKHFHLCATRANVWRPVGEAAGRGFHTTDGAPTPCADAKTLPSI